MTDGRLEDWIDEHSDCTWYLKRLSPNDTQQTGGHQAGPYFPKRVLLALLPALNRPGADNPRVEIACSVDSHGEQHALQAIWYNNRQRGRTRDETRVTGWGGSQSVLLDTDSTGALVVLAFCRAAEGDPLVCHVWVCRDAADEDSVEALTGPVNSGYGLTWPDQLGDKRNSKCWLRRGQIPPEWLVRFPSGQEILDKTIELQPASRLRADARLLRRLDCEYRLFESVEEVVELGRVSRGYDTMDEFLKHANSVTNRRRSRAGNAVQLHVRRILGEERLVEDLDFAYNRVSEENKRPDFLFPSVEAYRDPAFPQASLRMLGVKRTLKDRWRQVLNEADRIPLKHLLTLDKNVTENQFREIHAANVQLVVPRSLQKEYLSPIQPYLQAFEDFIEDIRRLQP